MLSILLFVFTCMYIPTKACATISADAPLNNLGRIQSRFRSKKSSSASTEGLFPFK